MAIKVHGSLQFVGASHLKNANFESLAADPAIGDLKGRRQWYNSTENRFKYAALDGTGAVVVHSFPSLAEMTEADETLRSDIEQQITDLIGNAPDALNTLKEIADYIAVNPDANVLEAIQNHITQAKEDLRGQVTEAMDTFEEVEDAVGLLRQDLTSLSQDAGGKIGDLTSLSTTNKLSVVGAINEVVQKATNDKTALTNKIDDLRKSINDRQFSVTTTTAAQSHSITHNLGTKAVLVQVWVQQPDGSYDYELANMKPVDDNTVVVSGFETAVNIIASVQAVKAIIG